MELQSPQTNELDAALAKAQGAFPQVPKTKKSHFGMYADLAELIAAITPALSANGLCVKQKVVPYNNQYALYTKLSHSSGQFEACVYPLKQVASPQQFGSEITYARRYSLGPLVGVSSVEDDDGQGAEEAAVKKTNTFKKDPYPRPHPSAHPQVLQMLFAEGNANGYDDAAIKALTLKTYPNVKSRNDLTKEQILRLIDLINAGENSAQLLSEAETPKTNFPFEKDKK